MRDRVRVHPRGALRLARMRVRGGVQHIIIDADGCLTDGQIYLAHGADSHGYKKVKVFGPDDDDAIKEALVREIDVRIVSADMRGIRIVEARGHSHGVPVIPCTPDERYMLKGIDFNRALYIGDGYHDWKVMKHYGFGIAPADAWPKTKRTADAVTSRPGGKRAVAQAIDFALRRMVR